LLAKGRLLGIQFQTLFRDDLFFTASAQANKLAQTLSNAITAAGHELVSRTETNQLFPILPNSMVEKLEEDFRFYRWASYDENHITLRLVTSWATEEAQVMRFISKL